jgi:Fe-S oxidoreductase
MSKHSGNTLTEEQIEQLMKRLRGVEHIEPIVTIESTFYNMIKLISQIVVMKVLRPYTQ